MQINSLKRGDYVHDPQKAVERIKELRATGLSLRQIGRSLSEEKLAPPRGKRWYAGTIADLISKNTLPDKLKAIQLATKLRNGGMSLRRIGEQLMMSGITPPKGGHWHPEQVSKLLKEAQIKDMADTLQDVLGPAPRDS
jgi:DNA-binding transcriptional MerR regulator